MTNQSETAKIAVKVAERPTLIARNFLRRRDRAKPLHMGMFGLSTYNIYKNEPRSKNFLTGPPWCMRVPTAN